MCALENAIQKLEPDKKDTAFWLLWELWSILMWWENEVCPRELAIYNAMPQKISRSSFTRHCDENHISKKLARNYCLVKSWWRWIDQIAQSASFTVGDWEWNEVDVEDVVEFMNSSYRGWTREFIRKNLTTKMRPIVEELRDLWIFYNYSKIHTKQIKVLLELRTKTSYKAYYNEDVPF